MHLVVTIAAGFSVLFTVLAVAGLIHPSLGLSRTRERALIRNGSLALVAYLVLAVALSAGDPNQRFLTPGVASQSAPAATPPSARH